MNKLLINDDNKALVNNAEKAYVVGSIDALVGTSFPITFNAASGKMLKLIRYGECEQEGTPTPSAPIGIACNNGVLSIIDDELPIGYRRLIGIKHQSANIVIPFYLTGDDTLRFRAQGIVSAWIGAYHDDSANDNYSFYASTTSGAKYARYNGQQGGSVIYENTWCNIVMSPTGIKGSRNESSFNPAEFTCTVPLSIGATTPTGTPSSNVSFEGNIVVDGRLTLIPCERVSDGALGYYNGTTFYTTSEGTLTSLGYDYSHSLLRAVGTSEIISGLNSTKTNLLVASDIITGKAVRAGSTSTENPLGSEISNTSWACTGYIKVKPNTDYISIVPSQQAATGAGLVFYTNATVEGAIRGVTTNQQNAALEYHFTTPNNCNYIRFSWNCSEGIDAGLYCSSGFVEDLLAVGDYVDEQDIISGTVTRNVGVVVFDGTENWEKPSDYFRLDGLFQDTIPYSSDNPAIICSHFVGRPSKIAASGMVNGDIKLGYTSVSSRLYLKYAETSTVADLKTYLANQHAAANPVIVIYPLATPVIDSVTPQSLNTTAGQNSITDTTEISNPKYKLIYKI